MKKYLMMSLAALAIVSCSKSDDVYNPNAKQEETKAAYANAFVAKFGQPAANHDWGFSTTTSQGAITRSHWKNKNQYRDVMYVPDEPTANEISVVTDWFTTHKSPATYNVNWSDFFVWQISATSNGTSHMDQLWCGASKSSMEHVNDFNSGNNPDHSHVGPATFMYDSGTAEFAYQESLNNGGAHTVYDHFVCIPGSVIAPNDPTISQFYYVGLDYEADGTGSQDVERDYIYNDWIVRINPGEYKDAVRIVCEDLGTTDDFDFNDVVFDAVFDPVGGTNNIVITLQAAGGTLPLYVGGQEVHEMLGVGTGEMVNTGRKSVPVAIYRIPFNGTRTWSDADYAKIEVKVQGKDAIYVLEAPQGKAPEKILVDNTFAWPSERVNINETYPLFNDYVQNSPALDWY